MFGYFRRLKNSFAAMIIGLIMIPAAIALHAWNEYRTVHRSRGLAEAAEVVETIPDVSAIDASRDGRLVHLTGLADTDEILEDAEFQVRQKAIHLARRVEMFQWKEDKDGKSGNDRSPSYSYDRVWSKDQIDSSRFHQRLGHDNPSMKFPPIRRSAGHVWVGAFTLNDELKNSMQVWKSVEFPEAAFIAGIAEDDRDHFLVRNNELFWSSDVPKPEQPRVGDLRIRFEEVPPGTVSLVAQQHGETFDNYRTSNGEKIQRLYMDSLTAREVMDRLFTENTIIAWLLRIGGLVLSVIGFSMVLRPLSALTSVVPFLGSITGALLFFVALLLGVTVSSTVIGLSWIAVRPLLGIAMLAIAAAACYAIAKVRENASREELPEEVDASMFVT